MKKLRNIVLGTLCLFPFLTTEAQNTWTQNIRGRIENVTDYSQIVDYQANRSGMRKIGTKASAPLPCIGSPKVALVLVQFQDTKFTVAETNSKVKEYYNTFLNANTAPSVKDYFKEQSYGQFTPEFEIIGPVTLDNSYTYYGVDSESQTDVNIQEFYSEAATKAVTEGGVNWSDFDNDNDGVVDFLFFVYAGEGQNNTAVKDSYLIWPKESASKFSITVNEKSVVFGAFGCTCELLNGAGDGIGTLCHELSHGLGLPDFYDTVGSAAGMGYWDIMDAGCYVAMGDYPCAYSAYERDFMGWRELITLDPNTAYSLTLEPIETTGYGYKVVNEANEDEYFVLENRQHLGYDIYAPWPTKSAAEHYAGYAQGLMITHVDYDATAWQFNKVNTSILQQRMSIVPADGEFIDYTLSGYTKEWAESMAHDLYPDGGNATEMTSYDTFTGTTLGQTIDNITATSTGNITLDINGGVSNKYTLNDGDLYAETEECGSVDITYNRTFNNTNWQALYVPFQMSYDDWKDEFEVAIINDVNMYDEDEDGNYDKTEIEMLKLKSGSIVANTPYFIRALTTGDKTISLSKTTLYAATINSLECSSTTNKFTFTGTYIGVSGTDMYNNDYYGLSSGVLCTAADNTVSLNAQRWYMSIETKTTGYAKKYIPAEVKLRVLNDDDANAIEELDANSKNIDAIYTLDGRKINGSNLRPGIYIKNGKKLMVKY
ncbi:MAG: M6 family metalloprotease domain-containing protein [Bacteroidaceae bacterium]|nr:M6 family metalloprotease domain-containing protein [Bacteroidaceae bacterium]